MTPASETPAPVAVGWIEARWVSRAWKLLAASSALHLFSDNQADNDLWIHLLVGREILQSGEIPRTDHLSYTATGSPWVNHEWLSESVFAAVYQGLGPGGLLGLKLLIGFLTAWLLWRAMATRDVPVWARGSVMVLALAVAARGFAVRPQIITYLGVAWLMARLARETAAGEHPPAALRWEGLLGVMVAFALWVNTHGGVVFGLGVLGLRAALPPWSADRRRWAVLLAALAAACLNPYGPSLFGYIVNELGFAHPVTEWQPVAFGDVAQRPFLLLLGALVVTLPFARTLRRQPWWAVLVAITAAMALRSQRHTPLLALCAAVPLVEQLAGAAAWLQQRFAFTLSPRAMAAVALGVLVLAATQLSLVVQRFVDDGVRIVFDAADYPVGAVRFMQAEGTSGNLAVPLEWGGYTLWHTAPAIAVSLDGRFATVYPRPVVAANFAFFRGDLQDGTHLLDAYPTTLVLAPRGAAVAVRDRPDWHLRYRDEVADLYAAGPPRLAAAGQSPTGRLRFP